MITKKCSSCNIEPMVQTDELGVTYRLICANCARHTQDLISPNSTLANPHCDENTLKRLVTEWNEMN